MWDLPGPGLEPISPALAGGFLTTEPRGKSLLFCFVLFCFTNFSLRADPVPNLQVIETCNLMLEEPGGRVQGNCSIWKGRGEIPEAESEKRSP